MHGIQAGLVWHARYVVFRLAHALYRLLTLTSVLLLLSAVVLGMVELWMHALVAGLVGFLLWGGGTWLLVGRWLR